jgi:hypothetical protein
MSFEHWWTRGPQVIRVALDVDIKITKGVPVPVLLDSYQIDIPGAASLWPTVHNSPVRLALSCTIPSVNTFRRRLVLCDAYSALRVVGTEPGIGGEDLTSDWRCRSRWSWLHWRGWSAPLARIPRY